MEALIDTSIVVDILREQETALIWMEAHSDLQLAITPIVWMEIIAGSRDKPTQDRIIRALRPYFMIHLTDTDMDWAMRQFRQYRLSHNVGILDCLIAAPAYRLQLPLYSRNLKHFEPLLGSLAQKPYRAEPSKSS